MWSNGMYLAMIVLLMLVLPVASAVAEFLMTQGAAGWLALIGKWFVFWAVGIRLAVAGVRQVLTPTFTAELLRIKDKAAHPLVRELGFGNLAIGTTGALTLALPNWTLSAAMCGGLFYGFSGVQHIFSRDRNSAETSAMVSDLFVFAVLAVYVGISLLQR
jgi:hypothetical protein